uniref:Large ribosomal subunit protein uL29c n=1 Tax=Hydropuntia rangiferina TaxID=338881 RepID=A0A345U8I4_9FLOR|nr:ribosomal protein L29 [Hydropuntia rangiferina]AXI96770.1 ribosomal protein L29 [Hydropuntia rangiferina]UAD87451.1 ribosomal protein L29 [Hydropuntia rangiferina]
MALPNINNIKNLTKEEIKEKIIEIKKEILELKFKQATKQNIKSHLFKHKKHQLSQLLTIQTKSNHV